ncbi:hypothetical protein NY2A_B208L [Paramecium bursaria Chlorella virus NY2A]|uniref:Uncharacterized protein B208L n=1 Tax=Paramecium bursaria Chlorella virus NY2A TaxID=46021 RepID=A7IW83_PBCVN|nr:hypothetical protein NY2A_B208L [Paramecium bursaria Chlorella virus NY2A]ABT14607.1 hypothetical protein NY2A_B208L [Paramecium bursaria Chlorella virus NY2A]
MSDVEYETFSDVESVSSIELEHYTSYDEEMSNFIDMQNDWMIDNDEENIVYFNSWNDEELPDYVEDTIDNVGNLTQNMIRVLDRLYPNDEPDMRV